MEGTDAWGRTLTPANRPNAANRGLAGTRPVEVLTTGECERLLRAALEARSGTSEATRLRDHALIAVLWRCGLRCSEALDLYPRDIDPERGMVTVRCGKGSKRRVVGASAFVLERLEPWLERRAELGINGQEPVFCAVAPRSRGGRMADSQWRGRLPRIARQAGIEKRVHPHALRHACAVHLEERGVPLRIIQQVLGHDSLATTEIYLRRLNPREVVSAMREW